MAPGSSGNSSLPVSYSNGQSKVVAWLQESEEMDKCAEGKCYFPSVRREKSDSTSRLIQTFGLPISLMNLVQRAHERVFTAVTFIFRACAMSVQPD